MNSAIETMLAKYNCQTNRDYVNALKEIFQEIALLGLWRAKFFEKAAFYGGTALRTLYGLDRFSEGIDFSLLEPNNDFSLLKYNEAIISELSSFGFDVNIVAKNNESKIQSAFIKANTIKQLLAINVSKDIAKYIHSMNVIKVKVEIDTLSPPGFSTEAKKLLLPIPFSVLTYAQKDLFAGKLHALLCRKWQKRVKGRDWYDYYWYVSRNTPVNLIHLKSRLVQSWHWEESKPLNHQELVVLINDEIESVDFNATKNDIVDFLKDKASVDLWSHEFFKSLTKSLISV